MTKTRIATTLALMTLAFAAGTLAPNVLSSPTVHAQQSAADWWPMFAKSSEGANAVLAITPQVSANGQVRLWINLDLGDVPSMESEPALNPATNIILNNQDTSYFTYAITDKAEFKTVAIRAHKASAGDAK